jgi:hypothetical protein
VLTNTSSTGDILVSRGLGLLPATSNTSVVSSGLGQDDDVVTLVDIAWRLKAIEDIVRPMQPVLDTLVALEDIMCE